MHAYTYVVLLNWHFHSVRRAHCGGNGIYNLARGHLDGPFEDERFRLLIGLFCV